ncbi:M20/M25/M40 family metallo-hydrolase [Winogradskyella litorisediminis]|uniref:M20/M25/M40 family metallo-hydrolase n=1 Tax=Winogradskyella litorisediminis TaxID=1156618 RepID=A0ABW3N5N3_9FLAO
MKNFIQILVVCFTFVFVQSCGQNKKEDKVKDKVTSEKSTNVATTSYDSDVLLKHIKTLSSDKFEGRKTGTEGNKKAQDYIVTQFKSLEIKPFGSDYKHNFQFKRKAKTFDATNVLAMVEGTEHPKTYIVISAHYDHLGMSKDGKIYNGADDDASGVAALFAFAEMLKANPPKHSVILAAFDAEEMGLQGAKYFVDKMKDTNIIANINMDMISRSSKNELYAVGSRYTEGLKTLISEFKNPTETKLLVGHDGADGKEDWTFASDHGPFHRAEIPFLYFGNEDHAAYHKPTDDFEDITPEFYKNSVTIIHAVFRDLDAKGL